MKEKTPETSVASQLRATDPSLAAAHRDGLYVGELAAQRGEQRLAPVGAGPRKTIAKHS